MFRNLRVYQLSSPWPRSEDALDELLAAAAFQPCGTLSERSYGFEAPAVAAGVTTPSPLCRRVAGADLMRLRTQSRVLPAAAVNEALDVRIAEFTERTQAVPDRREKMRLKEDVMAELMPRALLKSERTHGFCLFDEKLLAIDATTESQAERFLDALRNGLGTLQITPMKFQQSVAGLLNTVFLGGGPSELNLGRECRMQDPGLATASVQWTDVELEHASVRKHVSEGFRLIRLAVEYDSIVSAVLDEECVFRKIRFLGGETAAIEDEAFDEEPLARLDTEFVLVAGTFRRWLADLGRWLGGMDGATG